MQRVAVVIPVRTADELLARQARAVLAQDVAFPFAVVLACNAADERVCAAIEHVVTEIGDRRLHVVSAHGGRNAAHARNMGAQCCDAEVVAFCDADDEVAPGWLSALVAGVAPFVAVGGYLDERRFAIRGQEGWRPPATPGTLPKFLGASYLVSANMAVMRCDFDRAGGFDVSLLRCEDIAVSWALRAAGVELVFAPEAVVHYRHRQGVRALIRQHYFYGRGMSQVLHRYGVPHDEGIELVSGLAALRPNGQPLEQRSFVGSVVRRASIAAGRAVGLVFEASRRHGAVVGGSR